MAEGTPEIRILYHEHAKARMLSRGISEETVREVLSTFDTTYPADRDRTRYVKHTEGDGIISVVAVIRKISDIHFVVYTVYREKGNHG